MKNYYLYKNRKFYVEDDTISDKYLQYYNKESLLESFYKISKEIYNLNTMSSIINLKYKFYIFDKNKKYKIGHDKTIVPSQLIRLSFSALIHGNDKYDTKTNTCKIENDINLLALLDNNLCGNVNRFKNNCTAMLYTMGQDQFWCQQIYSEFHNFSRNFEILKYIKCCDKDIIFNETLGMSYDDYNRAMVELLTFYISVDNQYEAFEKAINYDENIYKLIEYYTFCFESIDTNMDYNMLLCKPFVKLNNRYILTNIYALFKCFSGGAYWVIRNYYYERNDYKFIREFGDEAELHINNLFNTYLYNKFFYKKIKEKKYSTCDWVIETDKYILLTEQKSYLGKIKLRNINLDLKEFRDYFYRYRKAISQLNNTEKNEYSKTNKKVVKIILHYDEFYFQSNIIDDITNKNNNNIIMLNMSEFEKIIYCLSNNEEKFNDIIEKTLYGYDNYDGKDIEVILREYKIINDYFENVVNHGKGIMNKIVEEIKLKRHY